MAHDNCSISAADSTSSPRVPNHINCRLPNRSVIERTSFERAVIRGGEPLEASRRSTVAPCFCCGSRNQARRQCPLLEPIAHSLHPWALVTCARHHFDQ